MKMHESESQRRGQRKTVMIQGMGAKTGGEGRRESGGAEATWRRSQGTKQESNGAHSSALAWRIPWTEEPGGLQSMGTLRVGHD